MGNQPQQPVAQPKPLDPMDAIIDLKMTSKRFERESKTAEKEYTKQVNKAKLALKQGNEEGAKLYLQSATQKKKDSLNMLRMSTKLDAISTTIKSNISNQTMIQSLQKIQPYIEQHATQMPIEQMANQLKSFESAMDEITVQQKIMEQITMQNTNDYGQNLAVDDMLKQMKQELNQEINQDLQGNAAAMFNELKQNQMQINAPNQQVNQGKVEEFKF